MRGVYALSPSLPLSPSTFVMSVCVLVTMRACVCVCVYLSKSFVADIVSLPSSSIFVYFGFLLSFVSTSLPRSLSLSLSLSLGLSFHYVLTNIPLHNQDSSKPQSFLVTGGCGFLGRHIVDYLVDNGQIVRVLDLHQSFEDHRVNFVIGDITDEQTVRAACEGIDVVFHVASLTEPWGEYTDFHEVNVTGTSYLINACLEFGVRKLVYTSTGSVVIDGSDIKGGDESLEYPKTHLDHYSATKAEAEQMVIKANRVLTSKGHNLLTCSLRPHAMFGPRDSHFIAQLIAKAREGDITHLIGDGANVCDFTYVINAVHAHILAAEALSDDSPVAGECYFVTNGEPRRFWDFINRVLQETGCVGPTKSIAYRVAYGFAYSMELVHWLVSPVVSFRPTITRHMVCTMSCDHWFTHSKATRHFGYRPIVSLDEGLAETIAYFQKVVRRTQT
jgi:sterol-4alpha-carboxylate 3-dehydrogenase (decarboxylating)